jgi:hypothetical protein
MVSAGRPKKLLWKGKVFSRATAADDPWLRFLLMETHGACVATNAGAGEAVGSHSVQMT